MSETVLYLSPHFDDVVFSCPRHLLSQTRQGRRVVVATVFSDADGSGEGQSLYQIRKAEDSKALSILGATQLTLGLSDAPYRDSRYRTFSGIVLSNPSSDEATLARVRESIETAIVSLNPVEILAPLGVGTHIDHLLVHEAIRTLDPCVSIVRYYEDQPYATVRGAVQFRLNQLGIDFRENTEIDWNIFIDSFLGANYVERFLGDDERKAVLSILHHRWAALAAPSRVGSTESTTTDEKGDSLQCYQAAAAYRSQIQDFLGDHSVSSFGKWTERLWRLDS